MGDKDIIEAMARAMYNDYWHGNDKWPDATDNERKLYKDQAKAAYEAMLKFTQTGGNWLGYEESEKFIADILARPDPMMKRALEKIENMAHTDANVIFTADDGITNIGKLRKYCGEAFRDIQKIAKEALCQH